jgi:repressor of nif and glnA expression
MSDEKTYTEEIPISGEDLLSKIKELIHEGNIRRIIIRNQDGRNLIDIPLTVGVVGVVMAPQLAAIGAIAALLGNGSIVVEKVKEE